MKTMILQVFILVAFSSAVSAQSKQRGLIKNSAQAYQGYTLFATLDHQETHLIDMQGQIVHSWKSETVPANSVFLLPNGDLLRAAKTDQNARFGTRGPSGGRIEKYDWNGAKLWDFVISNDDHHQHHDIEPLPNGNVLVIVWEYVSTEDAVEAGRKPEAIGADGLWPDKVIEVKQTGPTSGEIVWQWRSWEHLIQDVDPNKANYGTVAQHPELIDVNIAPRPKADWMHTNGIDYNPELDQIIVSLRTFGEFFVIDHSTTSEEAAGHTGGRAGHGGDILYRWGNPSNYRAGGESDRKLFGQHDARWVDAERPGEGNITLFNNGSGRPDGEYSSVDEIVPPVLNNGSYVIDVGAAYDPQEPAWSYTAPDKMDFYSSFISGAERLPNGNTLICAGASGEFIEVTSKNEIVWQYRNPFTNRQQVAQPAPAQRDERPNTASGGRRGATRRRATNDARNPDGRTAPPARRARRGGSPQSPHLVFRVVRYAPDYPGLAGRDLSPVKE